MEPLDFKPDPTLTDGIRKGIAAHLEKANADDGGAFAISGEVVEIGDDETGQPRIVVHTTRDEIKASPTSLLFRRVKVTAETAPRAEAESTLSAQGEAASALALKFLVAGGFVTQAKADEALEIAAGYTHPAPRAAVDEAMVATRGAVVSAPTDVLAVCSECHEGAERLVCRRCVNDAQSCAVENELATQLRKTHMLFTGLDDCAVNVPE